MKLKLKIVVVLCLLAGTIHAQVKDLRSQLTTIIAPYKATVGIALKCIETGDTLSVNNAHHYPMQSVYKFPQAMAVLHQVDEGKMSLDQKVHISKKDLDKETWSPMYKKYPNGNVDLSLGELLDYAVSQSDNNACDILFRLLDGPLKANQYIHSIGFSKIQMVATEREMHQKWTAQYTNWAEPTEMTALLEAFYKGKYLSKSSTDFLMKLMVNSSNSPKRLKGLLPETTVVAHKTGSSGANKTGLIGATNDVGIITLPDGRHLAITVFVSDATEDFDTTESIIAQIAKATCDFYLDK
ncbi:MAG: class A beta-lactamase, subclass A2 [Chitinophagaceae bacterium]|jgi:beta-lactamase class A